MKAIVFTCFTIIVLGSSRANGSTPVDTAKKQQTSQSIFYNAGLQYISNLTYAGRKDNSSVPILLPNFTVIQKKGFFISGSGYLDLNGWASNAEGFSLTPGYVFSFDDKKLFGGSLSATKYFITGNSPIILATFNATVDAQLSYKPRFAEFTIAGSYRLAQQNSNDIINNIEVTKDVMILKSGPKKNRPLKITPDVTLYAGTQSFVQTYYTQSQVQRAVNNPGNTNPLSFLYPNQSSQSIINQTVTQQNQREVKNYNLLALSASAPVSYNFGRFKASLSPYFIKTLNQINYTNAPAQSTTYFLFSAGLNATF